MGGLGAQRRKVGPACLRGQSEPIGVIRVEVTMPVPAGDSAIVREFGFYGLNWLPHFADKEVEA